jgi:hypothetical protein
MQACMEENFKEAQTGDVAPNKIAAIARDSSIAHQKHD